MDRLDSATTLHVYRMMVNVVRRSTYAMFLNGMIDLSYYDATLKALTVFIDACDKRVDNGESLTTDDANVILKGLIDESCARRDRSDYDYNCERAKRRAWSLLED